MLTLDTLHNQIYCKIHKMKASPFYLNLIGVKVYVGNTTSTMVILNCVCCIFYHVNTDHRGQLLLTSCIHFMTHLFLDESSLSPWQILRLTSYECSPRFFEEYDTNNVRSCKQNLPKKKKPLWKTEGQEYNMKLLWWSVMSLPPVDLRSLKLRERGRLITPCC